jgi:hypothetical protein
VTVALVILALGMGMRIEGSSGCPDPSEIHERMRPLLTASLWASEAHRARIERSGDQLTIDLTDQDGLPLARRTVAMAPATSCSDQAGEVAVILAAWEVRLQGGDLGMPDLPKPPPPPPEVSPPPKPSGLQLGAGALMSLVQGQAAFGGMGTLVLGGESSPWIGALSLTAVGAHSLSIEPGLAKWDRLSLVGGPGIRLRWGALALEPSLAFALCWIQIHGVGFTTVQTANDYDLGLWAGLRLSVALGSLRPWFSASIGDWLRGQQVQVNGLGAPVKLPNVQLLLALGLSFELT